MSKKVIYLEDAITAVNIGAFSARTIYGRTDEGSTALHETVRAIKALPSAEPQWIPSSEPPKNEGTYLVYAPDYRGGSSSSKENYNGVMFSKYKNGKWSIEHGYYERPNCVTAWMPLPTYEGVKE